MHGKVAAGLSIPADHLVLMLGTSPAMQGGIAAVVAALRDGGLFDIAKVRYVATHVDGNSSRKVMKFLGAVFTSLRILASGRVVLAHAHVSSGASFWRKALLLWTARRFGVPTVFHLHSGGFKEFATQGLGGPISRWVIRRTLESSGVVVVLTQRWADWVYQFAPASRVRVVGNPVHIPATLPPRRVGIAPVLGRVLFLGMICEAKGSFDLLRAWTQFRKKFPGWRLVVGGNGDVDRFLGESQRLGVRGDIDYVGWVSGADKVRELDAADIFVLPSYKEGMPVSVLEAMAYGASVIVTPVGGVPDMMQSEVHGLWVEPGDVDGLASCLERLAGSHPLRMRLATAAREHVLRHFSVDVAISRMCEVYRDAISSTRG